MKNLKILNLLISCLFIGAIFAGSLSGNIKFDSKKVKKLANKKAKEQICGNGKSPIPYESVKVDEKGNFQNVIVWLKTDKKVDVPKDPVILDQVGCRYSPHVFSLVKGQELRIKNSDKEMHNVNSQSSVNPFNAGQPAGTPDLVKIWNKTEEPFKIKCDVHGWMSSYGIVLNHSYVAISDNAGNYKIENIPPGEYEVIAWQEKFGNKGKISNKVTITDKDTKLDITFKK